MLAVARKAFIREQLQEHKSVRITEFAALLNVTNETIRRDLREMEVAASDPSASLSAVITAAVNAAKDGVEKTKDMVPVFGKAAVHAAQSAGVPDQGATAGYYKILGLSNYING